LRRRWSTVASIIGYDVSARLESLLSSIAIVGEIDPRELERDPSRRPFYDWEAWERLCRGEHDRCAELRLLDLPDEVVERAWRARGPHEEFLNSLLSLEARRVASGYAYAVAVSTFKNRLYIRYATSKRYFDEFERLKERYAKLIESLNHMCWDSIKYLEYAAVDAKIEEVRKKVLDFYRRIPAKHIDVLVTDDEVRVWCPRQLKGLIIGRGGQTVNRLQQLLGLRVKVVDLPSMTEAYAEEHPELPTDEETMKLVFEATQILKELERRGVTLKQLEKFIETMNAPEDEGLEEVE
jgi:transcription antitermination factor NusA-like protein